MRTITNNFFSKAFLVVAVIVCTAGCTAKKNPDRGTGSLAGFASRPDRREIVDRSGRTIVVHYPINRIVSAAPSNTEIIVDLGLAEKLIAIDRNSTDMKESPFGTTFKLPAGLTIIDFSYPDAEALLNLEPDIIIAHGHNTTVSGDNPFRLLEEMGIPVVYITMSKSIDGIYEDISFIADLLEVKESGEALISFMKAQVDELSRKTAQIEVSRSVYFELSAAPEIFTFGKDSYINDMITVIGGRNIFGNDNWVLSPSVEAIIERNPDVIITGVDYLDDPIGELKSRDGFEHTSAVINNRIYQIDTNSLVRPSARIVLALNQMARAVYPEVYEQ